MYTKHALIFLDQFSGVRVFRPNFHVTKTFTIPHYFYLFREKNNSFDRELIGILGRHFSDCVLIVKVKFKLIHY